MKSSIKQIIKNGIFLPKEGNENNEYKIPIYQRHYDWEKEHIVNLFNDLAEAIKIKKPHYTGSFLLTKEKKYIVIDGQQRMISTFLLLKGFQLCCESQKVKDEINNIFFTDPKHPYADYLRLDVSNQDKNLFTSIICSKNFNSIQDNNTKLYSNFVLGYEFFKQLRKQYSDEDILRYGFEELQICELIIEDDVDDEAQKIFRDLNSKGQTLKNSDLIRNFLLMSREDLYYSHWQTIELMFTKDGEFQSDLFEEFIFNYVLLKRAEKTNENKIFNSYVSYCSEKFGEFSDEQGEFDREKAVNDLYKYARIFKLFLNINIVDSERSKYNDTIKLLAELRDMDQTTSYPFLLRVAMDEVNGLIDVKTLNEIINLVIIYYLRAVVCRISSGSRRGYLLTMYKNVFGNVSSNINRYYEAIYKYFHEIGSGSAMPTEEKFLEELKTFDLYSNKPVCRQVLKVIVNNRYPNEYHEKIKVEKPTIEHLLPQTPTDKWKEELNGKKKLAEAMEYVDTLGNLSLAYGGKNSELGNKSRKEKVEILKKYSASLYELNKDFIELAGKFSLDFIKQREKRLSAIIEKCYKLAPVKTNGIYFENFDIEYGSTSWDERFKGRTPTYIEIEGESFKVNSFWDVSYKMYEYFGKKYKDKFEKAFENNPIFGTTYVLSKEPLSNYERIPETDYYYHCESGGNCFYSACRAANALGIAMKDIRLSLRKQNFDDIKIEEIEDISEIERKCDKFVLKRSDEINAFAYYFEGKMIVVKGSIIEKEVKPYLNDCFVSLRNQLIKNGFVDSEFVVQKNIMFNSPSGAACFLLGYNANGKTVWKRVSDNKSLKEIIEDWRFL